MREGHDIAKIDAAHGREGAADARRRQGVQSAVGRRHPRQRDAVLLGGAGAAGRKGRRDIHQPVCRAARRHRDERHGCSSARSSRSTITTDFTTEVLVASCRHPDPHRSKRRKHGRRHLHRARRRSSTMLFNHPLTSIGLEKFLKDWEKAQAVKALTSARQRLPISNAAPKLGGGEERLQHASTKPGKLTRARADRSRCSIPARSRSSTSSSRTAASTSAWRAADHARRRRRHAATASSTGVRCSRSRRTSPSSADRRRKPTPRRS